MDYDFFKSNLLEEVLKESLLNKEIIKRFKNVVTHHLTWKTFSRALPTLGKAIQSNVYIDKNKEFYVKQILSLRTGIKEALMHFHAHESCPDAVVQLVHVHVFTDKSPGYHVAIVTRNEGLVLIDIVKKHRSSLDKFWETPGLLDYTGINDDLQFTSRDLHKQALIALHDIHTNAGIMHGDIKPDNIIVTSVDSRGLNLVKFIDFEYCNPIRIDDSGEFRKNYLTKSINSYSAPETALTFLKLQKNDKFTRAISSYDFKKIFQERGLYYKEFMSLLEQRQPGFDFRADTYSLGMSLLSLMLNRNTFNKMARSETVFQFMLIAVGYSDINHLIGNINLKVNSDTTYDKFIWQVISFSPETRFNLALSSSFFDNESCIAS